MASGKSARRLLQFFKTTDAPNISAWSEALAAQLDNDVEGGQGKLSERPAASLRGRIFVVQGDATAANNGIVWWDTGASWLAVNLPANGQTYSAKVERTSGEYEPSSIRPTLVTVEAARAGGALSVAVEIGGVTVGRSEIAAGGTATFSFICPAGAKYLLSVGAITKAFTSYLML